MSTTSLSRRFPTAFVTGAASGLGQAFVRLLLAEGVQVWGSSRDKARLELFSAERNFHPVILDLRDPQASEAAFVAAAQEAGGCFALVVQNAGFGLFGRFDETEASAWTDQLETMVLATLRLSHLAYAGMRACGRGALVHVSSLSVDFPLPYMTGYNMSKAALSALGRSLMQEAGGSGVAVIDFRPGDYRTGFNDAMRPDLAQLAAEPQLARVWARLEENLASAPTVERAAADLRRALARGRSGIVRSGSFFQARLAPFLASLAPDWLVRRVSSLYFRIN